MKIHRGKAVKQLLLVSAFLASPSLVTAQTQTWSPLAVEGASFSVSGTQTVRYGAGTSWVQKSVTNSGTCTNAFFGLDPIRGTAKACQLLSTVTSSPGTGTPDMMGEWANCRLPEQIQFVLERQGWWPGPFGVSLKVKYPGGALETKAAKNPEAHDFHAPGHTQNCTTGQSATKNTQWITFKLRTSNFFGAYAGDNRTNVLGDHLAIFLRGKWGPPGSIPSGYSRTEFIRTPQYQGRGIAIWSSSGIQGEHFSLGQLSGQQTLQAGAWSNRLHPLVFRDGVTYTVSIIASDTSVSYQVAAPGEPPIYWSSGSTWHEPPADSTFVSGAGQSNARTTGTGFGVIPLCNASSCYTPPSYSDERTFTVDITEIAGGWF